MCEILSLIPKARAFRRSGVPEFSNPNAHAREWRRGRISHLFLDLRARS